jgi:hypothetical protein
MGILPVKKVIGVGPFDSGTCFQDVDCKRERDTSHAPHPYSSEVEGSLPSLSFSAIS